MTDKPRVSMFIFFYSRSQEGIGLIPFRGRDVICARREFNASFPFSIWLLDSISCLSSIFCLSLSASADLLGCSILSVFKSWDGERAVWHWVVLAGQRRALPARNARHSGGVGGWAASSFLSMLTSDCTGMKCMCVARLPLEIVCVLLIKPFLICHYSVFVDSAFKKE